MITEQPLKGFQNRQLIKHVNIPSAVASVSFTGLKGNTDNVYFMEMYLEFASGSGGLGNVPVIQFNGDTGANYVYARQSYNSGDRNTYNAIMMGIGNADVASRFWIPSTYILAESGRYRLVKNVATVFDGTAGTLDDQSSSGLWNNTANEITSLVVKDYNGKNINYGWINLYKQVLE